MGEIAGMNIIELYEAYHIWAIIDVIAACLCVVLAVLTLLMSCDMERDNQGSYIVAWVLFFVIGISLFAIGLPNVHEKGFRAKVDNVLAWSEISVNYSMVSLDEDGVFTFKER